MQKLNISCKCYLDDDESLTTLITHYRWVITNHRWVITHTGES